MEMDEEQRLIYAIALRVGTGRQLAEMFGTTLPELKAFVEEHRERIERTRERFENPKESALSVVEPGQLSDLWITNKYERLKQIQYGAEKMKDYIEAGGLAPTEFATAVRELRAYMTAAASELGQLLNRGAGDSGDGSYLSVDIQGVDMENLR